MVRVWSRLARGGESLAGGDQYVENMTDNTTSMCSLISVYPKLFIPRAIAKGCLRCLVLASTLACRLSYNSTCLDKHPNLFISRAIERGRIKEIELSKWR